MIKKLWIAMLLILGLSGCGPGSLDEAIQDLGQTVSELETVVARERIAATRTAEEIEPILTLEPGEIPITDGPVYYGGIEDGKCYVDIPACGSGACPVDWGREVSCDDWETPVQMESTPTPEIYLGIEGENEWLANAWAFFPEEDWTVEIDWWGDIIITDALSQTITISGPVTIQFREGSTEIAPWRVYHDPNIR